MKITPSSCVPTGKNMVRGIFCPLFFGYVVIYC